VSGCFTCSGDPGLAPDPFTRVTGGRGRGPPLSSSARRSHTGALQARLSIINDEAASASDRLKAMEQLESRALGRPKEHIETTTSAVDEYEEALRQLTPEERRQLMRGVEPD
jgi:hypothetical protein